MVDELIEVSQYSIRCVELCRIHFFFSIFGYRKAHTRFSQIRKLIDLKLIKKNCIFKLFNLYTKEENKVK